MGGKLGSRAFLTSVSFSRVDSYNNPIHESVFIFALLLTCIAFPFPLFILKLLDYEMLLDTACLLASINKFIDVHSRLIHGLAVRAISTQSSSKVRGKYRTWKSTRTFKCK